jgi:hypothetical protein
MMAPARLIDAFAMRTRSFFQREVLVDEELDDERVERREPRALVELGEPRAEAPEDDDRDEQLPLEHPERARHLAELAATRASPSPFVPTYAE